MALILKYERIAHLFLPLKLFSLTHSY